MKFTIKRSLMVESLKYINNIVDHNSSKPTLTGVKITVRDNKLILEATNSTDSFQQIITDLTIESEGSVLVKVRDFYGIISKLEQEEITIQQIDEKVLHISSLPKYSCNINLLDSFSFPILKFDYADFKKMTLSVDTLINICSRLKPFVSFNNIVNSYARGILFNPIDEKTCEALSSDGTRVAYYKFDYEGDQVKFIIEPKALDVALSILLAKKQKSLEIYLNEKKAIIKIDDILLSFSLIENTYSPNVIKVLLAPQQYSFTVKLSDLHNALNRGSVFVAAENRPIANFKLSNGKLNIKFVSQTVGDSYEEIELIKSNTNDYEVNLNQKLFTDLISSIKAQEITFNFNGPYLPIVITSENPYFLNLILPIRTA